MIEKVKFTVVQIKTFNDMVHGDIYYAQLGLANITDRGKKGGEGEQRGDFIKNHKWQL